MNEVYVIAFEAVWILLKRTLLIFRIDGILMKLGWVHQQNQSKTVIKTMDACCFPTTKEGKINLVCRKDVRGPNGTFLIDYLPKDQARYYYCNILDQLK
jgi:hypothetical protein